MWLLVSLWVLVFFVASSFVYVIIDAGWPLLHWRDNQRVWWLVSEAILFKLLIIDWKRVEFTLIVTCAFFNRVLSKTLCHEN